MVKETMTPAERIKAAVNLEPLDRIPFVPLLDILFACKYKGIPLSEGLKQPDIGLQAMLDVCAEVGTLDGIGLAGYYMSVLPKVSSVLSDSSFGYLIPGRELPENFVPQYEERPLFGEDDYDEIIKLGWSGFADKHYQRFNPRPASKIIDWADRQMKQYIKAKEVWQEKGVATLVGTLIPSPLMFFSLKRSLIQFTMDIYRQGDRVAAAMDAVVDEFIADAIAASKVAGIPRIMLILERGGGFYYPLKIFERFEWPYMKKMVEAFAAEDIITCMHFDQNWTINLPYLKDLPRAKCICELDSTTDIFKAKEILRDHMCIMGDVPATLTSTGKPEEVEAYCKKLIDVIGEGGGFILSSGCSIPVDCKIENLKAMVNSSKSYFPH